MLETTFGATQPALPSDNSGLLTECVPRRHHRLIGGSLYLINSLRSAGIRKADDLYREALLDPKVARALIQKMPAGADVTKLRTLAAILQRAAIVAPLAAAGGQQQAMAPSGDYSLQ
jgi:hypothetical protein